MKYVWILAAGIIGLPSVAMAASEPCPPRETGTHPWTSDGALPGDEYAWVYLTIGKDGRPQHCGIGQTNVDDSDRRFFICSAMMQQWQPASNEKPAPGSVVKRMFVIQGPHHDKVDKEARKRFFAAHPDQRPECYSDD